MKQKTDKQRLNELTVSLKAIVFSINQFFRDNEEMHLLTIKSQLRALIGMGGRNMKPLLLDLADQYQVPLYIYSFDNRDMQEKDTLISDIPASPSWTVKPYGEKYHFRDWLNLPAYFSPLTKGYVSRNKIFRQISDGNSTHYDEGIGELVEFLESIQYGKRVINLNEQLVELSGLNMFLFDLTYATVWLGNVFLCTINDQSHRIEYYNTIAEKAINALGNTRFRFILHSSEDNISTGYELE